MKNTFATLTMDEIELLTLFRQLTPGSRAGAILGLKEHLNEFEGTLYPVPPPPLPVARAPNKRQRGTVPFVSA